MRKAVGTVLGLLELSVAAVMGTPALSASPSQTCRFEVPADLDARPARWLGDCQNATAEGLGIVRAGAAEPYTFFARRMQGGRPVEGLLILHDGGWMVAVRFDDNLRVVSSDGLRPAEDDRVFAQAHAAAMETSKHFRKEGNKGSADYYAALARRITEGRPE